ncbi:LysR substrate-binding domain-containing protein [Mesorhizobium sp. B1-1-5]|uniref:LysR substrate-binding domain-containing protein n=1 Tax=Mesorhizobium sp. B1-1-5 TaxID=2589979 RepID=UPI0032B2CC37
MDARQKQEFRAEDRRLHGLAWGHLPDWLIEDDLRDGRLISIAGRHIPGRAETVAAVRRRDMPHGPVAEALWRHLQDSAGLAS